MSIKQHAVAGVVLALALAGCAGDLESPTTSTATPETTKTETASSTAGAAQSHADAVDSTQEGGPDADEVAAVLDELTQMNQREYRRQFLVPMRDQVGKDEFCKATDFTGTAVNPGVDFVTALMIGAAFSDTTDEDSFDRTELNNLIDWTNEFFEQECDWEGPDYSAGREAEEGSVNTDAVDEALGEATADPEDLPSEVPSPATLRDRFIDDAAVSPDGAFCTDPARVIDGVGQTAECATDTGVVGFMTSETMTVEAMAIWLMNESGRMLTTCQGSNFVAYAEGMGAADLIYEHVQCQFS